jgi:hypothetical protein
MSLRLHCEEQRDEQSRAASVILDWFAYARNDGGGFLSLSCPARKTAHRSKQPRLLHLDRIPYADHARCDHLGIDAAFIVTEVLH